MNASWTWHSDRLDSELTLSRWGEVGTPVLVFPSAGGSAVEIEQMGLIDALGLLLADERIKVYSVDSVAGRSILERQDSGHAAWLQNQFEGAVRWEVFPQIWEDCKADESLEVITAGSSYGAFYAVAALCRYPDIVSSAIGMSGTYDLTPWLDGAWSDDFYYASPIHYLPGLPDGDQLERLRSRFVLIATGTGAWEKPGESWWMGDVLGSKGIPNRVDNWPGWEHDWPTWHAMLPGYLHELL